MALAAYSIPRQCKRPSLPKPLRVLQLPANVASQMSITVRALREHGVVAQGIAVRSTVSSNENIETLRVPTAAPGAREKLQACRLYAQVLPKIARADVLHWYTNWTFSSRRDIGLASYLQKRSLVEFCGSDIRIASIDSAANPYFAEMAPSSEYRDAETYSVSRHRQEVFAASGSQALINCESLRRYIQPGSVSNSPFRKASNQFGRIRNCVTRCRSTAAECCALFHRARLEGHTAYSRCRRGPEALT